MRHYLFVLLTSSLMGVTSLRGQTWQWVNAYSIEYTDVNPQTCEYPNAVNPAGSTITAGFSGNQYIHNGKIYGDVDLRSIASDGSVAWQATLQSGFTVNQLSADAGGNVYMTGSSVQLGVQASEKPVLIKWDAQGEEQWTLYPNELMTGISSVRAMEITPDGTIYLGCDDGIDSYVLQLNQEGELINSILQSSVNFISSVGLDSDGNIYVAGGCAQSSAEFAGVAVSPEFEHNVYVIAYTPDGQYRWSQFVKEVTCVEPKLKVTPAGRILFTSHLKGIREFGEITLQGPPTAFAPDFFLACLNADGEYLWARETPGNGKIEMGTRNPIALDSENNIYFCGRIQGATYWEDDIITYSTGANDVVILKFSEEGVLTNAWTAGGSFEDRADGIAINGNDEIFVSGVSTGSMTFGSIVHTAQAGVYYPFTAKLADLTADVVNTGAPEVKCYPNPAEDRLFYQSPTAVSSYEIYEINGRLLQKEKPAAEGIIELNHLSPGLYFIRFYHAGRSGMQQKFIVK